MLTETKRYRKSRSQKRAKITRSKLKKAALDVFSGKSIDSATVEEITEKADVGKGTLYQHFEDKEEIVTTLVEEAVRHLIKRIRSYESTPETLEDILDHLLNAHYQFFADASEEFILLFQARAMLRLKSNKLDELEEPYLRYLEEIENQISEYLSPKTDLLKTRRLACAVAGFVFGFFSFAMLGMTKDEIEESIESLRQVFVRSLCTFLER